jgi:hypothetical protein
VYTEIVFREEKVINHKQNMQAFSVSNWNNILPLLPKKMGYIERRSWVHSLHAGLLILYKRVVTTLPTSYIVKFLILSTE